MRKYCSSMYINDKQRICIWLNNQCSKMQYKPGQRQQGLDFNWDKDNEKQMHTGYNFVIKDLGF